MQRRAMWAIIQNAFQRHISLSAALEGAQYRAWLLYHPPSSGLGSVEPGRCGGKERAARMHRALTKRRPMDFRLYFMDAITTWSSGTTWNM